MYTITTLISSQSWGRDEKESNSLSGGTIETQSLGEDGFDQRTCLRYIILAWVFNEKQNFYIRTCLLGGKKNRMSKYMFSIHHFCSTWRIIALKTQTRTPTSLWWLWSCNCHTGPEVVLQLNEQKGVPNNQVSKLNYTCYSLFTNAPFTSMNQKMSLVKLT